VRVGGVGSGQKREGSIEVVAGDRYLLRVVGAHGVSAGDRGPYPDMLTELLAREQIIATVRRRNMRFRRRTRPATLASCGFINH
jgi:hypothetical protein